MGSVAVKRSIDPRMEGGEQLKQDHAAGRKVTESLEKPRAIEQSKGTREEKMANT